MELNQMNQMYNNQMNFLQMPMNNNQFNNPMMNMSMMNDPMINRPMMNMPMLNNPMMNNMINPMEMNMQMKPRNQMMTNEIKPIFQKSKQTTESNNKKDEEEIKIPRKKYNPKREIPPILLKNANKKIETITFQVEKDLKPTKSLFQTENIDQIFNRLFQKRKKE